MSIITGAPQQQQQQGMTAVLMTQADLNVLS